MRLTLTFSGALPPPLWHSPLSDRPVFPVFYRGEIPQSGNTRGSQCAIEPLMGAGGGTRGAIITYHQDFSRASILNLSTIAFRNNGPIATGGCQRGVKNRCSYNRSPHEASGGISRFVLSCAKKVPSTGSGPFFSLWFLPMYRVCRGLPHLFFWGTVLKKNNRAQAIIFPRILWRVSGFIAG